MQVKAKAKFVPMSPRKLRVVAEIVRNKKAKDSLILLNHTGKKAARLIGKVLQSALANAVNNHHLKEEDLVISRLLINEGSRHKKQDKYHGARFHTGLIQKRSAHITVILEEKD